MQRILIADARILTLAGSAEPRRGRDLRELNVIEEGFILLEDGKVAAIGSGRAPKSMLADSQRIDAEGRVAMPCFVDCHTHACWAGNRFSEYEMRLGGAEYLDILRAGGGIMSTVRAVRAATQEALTELLVERLARMASGGTGTVEVKSGYGLTVEDEMKMLRAIRAAAKRTPQIVVPTFLGAHAVDPEQSDAVDKTISEALPAAAMEFPGITCDAFCEVGAWSVTETRRLFESAAALGCRLRIHTDQFNSLGMTRLAVEMGAASVDHLEALSPGDLHYVARSSTIAVALPMSGFQLDQRYAPVRELIDAGAAVAIASNLNPGTALVSTMPAVASLAVRRLRITPQEVIAATTYNAACVLGLQDEIGSLEEGKRADVQLLECRDERELGFDGGLPCPRCVIIDGRIVSTRSTELTIG